MKLIIDIPELDYECAKQRWMRGNDAHKMDYYISKGTPLDDVKAEIETALAKEGNTDTAKAQAIALSWVLELLDRIGKERALISGTPLDNVLDKIIAEIDEKSSHYEHFSSSNTANGLMIAKRIVEKYKAESEDA